MPSPPDSRPSSPSLTGSLFTTDPAISLADRVPGLTLIQDWITPDDERELLAEIDAYPWSNELKRRVQHRGAQYDYKRRSLIDAAEIAALPAWLEALSDRLVRDGFAPSPMQQAIVNEYLPGQGISRHVDSPTFDVPIVSLSLSGWCVMQFEQLSSGQREQLTLAPRSLLVLNGDARWAWRHAIPARRSDLIDGDSVRRTRRVSITFRRLRKNDVDPPLKRVADSGGD